MSRSVGQLLYAAALLAAVLLCTCASAQPAPSAATALDLLTVHQRALQAAPPLQLLQAQRAEREAALRAAGARLGPQLEAVWQQGGGRDALAARTAQGSLLLTQPLIDLPRWQARDAARHRLAAGEAEQAQGEQQLRQLSARLFVQLHAQSQAQRVQRELQQAYAEEARRMGVRHREGLAAAVDWRQSQSFQLLADAGARNGAQQLRALRQALVAHAGDASLLDAAIQGLRADALPPALEAPAAGSGRSPRHDAQRAERDAREQELHAARQATLPTLSLQAQAQRDLQSRPRHGSDWLLQLRIPLWDSGSRAAGRDAAAQRLRAAEAELMQLERDLAREQATQAERLLSAREQHATATGGLQAAEQTVAAMRIGQEQGTRSTTDVLLALQTLGQLRQLAVAAQLEAWLAWIDGLVAQGRFDEGALAALNTQLE
ncbi:TolC family protein [Inhella sp.]|uniref:TolC family protein n=1 Tax=Inhella sp. TaxID=1921806 RepID=UPI0035B4D14C